MGPTGLNSEARALELQRRLSTVPAVVAKLMHDASLRQLEEGERRKVQIEEKASAMLQAVGLSLGLLTTFGGAALAYPDFVASLGGVTTLVARGLLLFTFLVGILVAHFALKALKVSEFRTLSDDDLFNEQAIAQAAVVPDTDELYFHRYLTLAAFRIYWHNFELIEAKATAVHRSQKSFFCLLICLLLLAALVIFST